MGEIRCLEVRASFPYRRLGAQGVPAIRNALGMMSTRSCWMEFGIEFGDLLYQGMTAQGADGAVVE